MHIPFEAGFVLTAPFVLLGLAFQLGRRRVNTVTAGLLVALYVYLMFVAKYTLFPFSGWGMASEYRAVAGWFTNSNFVPFRDLRLGSRQMIGNVALGVPFGVLLPALLPRATAKHLVALCLAFGLSIEALQFVLGGLGIVRFRSVDVNDALLNFLGALLGLAWFGLCRLVYQRATQEGAQTNPLG